MMELKVEITITVDSEFNIESRFAKDLLLALINTEQQEFESNSAKVKSRILRLIREYDLMTIGQLKSALRKYSSEDIDKALLSAMSDGMVVRVKDQSRNGRVFYKYKLAEK